MAPRGLDLAGTGAMDRSDGEITQGCHDWWGVAGAQARAIFPKADIAHRVGAIFDTPVASV